MQNGDRPCKGEKRYWTNGWWREDFFQAVVKSTDKSGKQHDIWKINDGWNPENGAQLIVRWRTIR